MTAHNDVLICVFRNLRSAASSTRRFCFIERETNSVWSVARRARAAFHDLPLHPFDLLPKERFILREGGRESAIAALR